VIHREPVFQTQTPRLNWERGADPGSSLIERGLEAWCVKGGDTKAEIQAIADKLDEGIATLPGG